MKKRISALTLGILLSFQLPLYPTSIAITTEDYEYCTSEIEGTSGMSRKKETSKATTLQLPLPEKDVTFLVYIACDNDLNYFSKRNLDDMKRVGSNEFINIVAQVDGQGPYEKVKRYYVEKNNLVHLNKYDKSSEKLDFGAAQTLADFCIWARKNFPARHYVLVLWDHGIGILDSIGGKTQHTTELFVFNPETNLLEINRSINFIEYLQERELENLLKGICFSDTFGTYLTNQKLITALATIQRNCDNKKFDIIAFDACLMAMLEMADLLKPYANIMVGSQELELGAGYPYHKMLEPFTTKALTPAEFAQHMVQAYGDHYKTITSDYTCSAVDLTKLNALEQALERTTQLLLSALQHQEGTSVARYIRASKSRRLCTCFSEPSYIDLYDFLTNIHESLQYMLIEPSHAYLKEELDVAIRATQTEIDNVTLANQVGKNLSRAHGLSIYFPSRSIDPSYIQTPFVKNFSWINLIRNAM